MSSGAPSREGQGSEDFRIRRRHLEAPPAAKKMSGGGESAGGGGDPDPPPPPPPPSMSFADENGTDPADVAAQANTIKVPYDPKDPVYWFRRLEIQMELRSIKGQFWKRVVLEANLPAEVNETIKDLLIKERNSEGAATVYRIARKGC